MKNPQEMTRYAQQLIDIAVAGHGDAAASRIWEAVETMPEDMQADALLVALAAAGWTIRRLLGTLPAPEFQAALTRLAIIQ